MKDFLEMVTVLGVVATGLGTVGIVACAFADGFWWGLLTLFIPFIGVGSALRRWPGIVWLWLGGLTASLLIPMLVPFVIRMPVH